MDIKSLVLAVGMAGCAAQTKIHQLGTAEIRVTHGYNHLDHAYQVQTKEGDTLETIAHEFWLQGFGSSSPENFLEQYNKKRRFNEYKIQTTTQALPAGLTFEYHAYQTLPGAHIIQ